MTMYVGERDARRHSGRKRKVFAQPHNRIKGSISHPQNASTHPLPPLSQRSLTTFPPFFPGLTTMAKDTSLFRPPANLRVTVLRVAKMPHSGLERDYWHQDRVC